MPADVPEFCIRGESVYVCRNELYGDVCVACFCGQLFRLPGERPVCRQIVLPVARMAVYRIAARIADNRRVYRTVVCLKDDFVRCYRV